MLDDRIDDSRGHRGTVFADHTIRSRVESKMPCYITLKPIVTSEETSR